MLLPVLMAVAVGFFRPSPSPSPTPIPNGIHGTFVSLAETPTGPQVTFEHAGAASTLPLRSDALVRERPLGGDWKVIAATGLHAGAPVVVFVGSGGVTQIDSLYELVATRFVLVKNGYGVNPAGTIYKLEGQAATAGASLPSGAYVLLHVDPGRALAYDMIASRTPFAQAGGPPKVNVTIVVLVPVNTGQIDAIYMSTDALSWTPNAIRMSPLPGNRWTVTLSVTGGTLLKYKYTRGSWSSDERDLAGNEIPNRTLTANPKGPTQTVEDVVARWADRPS
jgi:hypothetical protein